MKRQSNEIRFLKHCVKRGENSARIHYSTGDIYERDGSGKLTGGTVKVVTLYAKGYKDSLFPIFQELTQNQSESMVDYFERDRVHIRFDHPLYPAALEAASR